MRFVFFHGKSLLSKLIRWFTRSDLSHVAYLNQNDLLIECWQFGKWPWQVWWDKSSFENHTPGTRYEVWELTPKSAEEMDCVERFFANLAYYCFGYDWSALFGFLLRWKRESNDRYICSEGCCTALQRWRMWHAIKPSFVSPDQFRAILQAAGARKIAEGEV